MELKTIRQAVSYTTGIDEGLIRSIKKRRTNGAVVMGTHIMTARQIAVGLAKKYHPDYSWEEIGWVIGTNDHASVIYHYNKYEAFVETDPEFNKSVFFAETEYLMRVKSHQILVNQIPDILKKLEEIQQVLKKHQNKAL